MWVFFGNIESVTEFIWKWLFQVFSNHPTDLSEKKKCRAVPGQVQWIHWCLAFGRLQGPSWSGGTWIPRISPAEVGSWNPLKSHYLQGFIHPRWFSRRISEASTGWHRVDISRWWFQLFFIFTLTWGNDPIWRAYFSNGVGSTTN